jgi:hypothetical protein
MAQRSAPIRVRSPAVAGTFYPGAAPALCAELERCLAGAPQGGPAPKALVVPHAGLMYSGPVAASAYGPLRGHASAIRRVVLIGPSHRAALHGLALPHADAFDTPFGRIPIDEALRSALAAHPAVSISDRPHELEHSLEVQLPFLQHVLGEVALLPLVAGFARAEEVAEVLDLAWGGVETLIVVSTDLSHYHDYETARERDAATARRIVSFEGGLGGEDACGCVGLNGFLLAARRRRLGIRQLDLRNSGDTAGDRRRVVGYGAWAFHESA